MFRKMTTLAEPVDVWPLKNLEHEKSIQKDKLIDAFQTRTSDRSIHIVAK